MQQDFEEKKQAHEKLQQELILYKTKGEESKVQQKKSKSFTTVDWTDPSKIDKAKSTVYGMEMMLERCDLKLEGRHHSGIDDSKNIAACVIRLLEEGFEFTQGMVNRENY